MPIVIPTYIGIDPGSAQGGIAAIKGRTLVTFGLKDKTPTDWYEFLAGITGDRIALIERVHAMPKQGVASSFSFGQGYGVLIGLLIALEIPFEFVEAKKWQAAYITPKESKGDRKKALTAAAQRIYPGNGVTVQVADSVLIADYLKQKHG